MAVYNAVAKDPASVQAAQQAAQQLAALLAAPTFLADTWPGASVRDVLVAQLLTPPLANVTLTFTVDVPGLTLANFNAIQYLQTVALQAPGEQPGLALLVWWMI